MHHLIVAITDLGDSAVTLPMAAVAIAVLLTARQVRSALWWSGCIAAAAAALGALKLVLTAIAIHFHMLASLSSPSGHAGMSAIVYGGFVLLTGPSLPRMWRVLARLGALALVLAIAASRLVLHAHSIAETAIGLAVGLAALVAFGAGLARAPSERVPVVALCAAALAVIGLMHGTRWHTEPMIRALSRSALVQELLPPRG